MDAIRRMGLLVSDPRAPIRKHAQAIDVWVDVTPQAHWKIQVRDNGYGFEATQSPHHATHVGLNIMKERAERIGASLNDCSSRDGTEVILTMH